MTFVELLTDLTRVGVHLEANADRLRFHPRSRVTPVQVDGLKAHKPDLLVALAEPTGPCPGCGSAVLVQLVTGPVVCAGCCPMPPEAAAERLVWNDELRAAEPYADALRAARAERTAPRAQFAPTPADDAPRCDRCGATAFRDVPIHAGRSVRRDCLACRRFLSFPTWYGENTDPEDGPR